MPTRFVNTGQPVNWSRPLNRGLLHWWKPLPHNWGSNTLFDIANRNHATKVSTATQWNAESILGGTKSISGWTSASYYSLASTVSLSSEYSIVAWWRLNLFSTYQFAIAGAGAAIFGMNIGSTSFYCRPIDGGTAYTPAISGAVSGQWQQAVMAVKYNTTSYCYLDNVKSGSMAVGTGITQFNTLGAYSSYPMLGSIAELRIYNKTLSDSEVFQLRIEALQGYPNLLNWIEPRAWSFGSAVQGGGGSGGFKPYWAINRSGILGGTGS